MAKAAQSIEVWTGEASLGDRVPLPWLPPLTATRCTRTSATCGLSARSSTSPSSSTPSSRGSRASLRQSFDSTFALLQPPRSRSRDQQDAPLQPIHQRLVPPAIPRTAPRAQRTTPPTSLPSSSRSPPARRPPPPPVHLPPRLVPPAARRQHFRTRHLLHGARDQSSSSRASRRRAGSPGAPGLAERALLLRWTSRPLIFAGDVGVYIERRAQTSCELEACSNVSALSPFALLGRRGATSSTRSTAERVDRRSAGKAHLQEQGQRRRGAGPAPVRRRARGALVVPLEPRPSRLSCVVSAAAPCRRRPLQCRDQSWLAEAHVPGARERAFEVRELRREKTALDPASLQ